MSASWDSDLSSIIEKTNTNLKLLRKIGDKPQVRASDVSVTNQPSLSRSGSASARPRAYVGAQDDAGSASSRSSARPRAFIRGDDDTSSMGSHGSARPKAYIRGDDDTGSMGSHGSARPKAFIRTDDDAGSVSSRASARPKAFIRPDDDANSASSRASARPKAFIHGDDDAGSVSSRASARPKAFIRGDDDTRSMSSRSSARPKAFIRGDDDTGSISSRSSARPKAFIRGEDDTGSMSSNQGLGRSRLDSGSSSGRPHVGIAGGGGLTAAMLQQHRATAGAPGPMADLGTRSRVDLDETRSMSGVSASRLRRPLGANGRVPHARALGASMGPRIRVPDADIPSDIPNHVIDEVKQSLETHFASRNGVVDKKVADLRTDVAGLTTQTSSLSSQISELRDAVLVSANSKTAGSAVSVSDPKIIASVQANASAIARLEEHSADLLGRKVSVDRELTELGTRVKSLSSATMKISTLEDNIEALVANRQKQEQGLFKLADRVQLMHRQMGSLVDMKAVENLLSIRLTRDFREMEDRLSQNVIRMAEKMEQKVQSMEKQSFSQRQESLVALKNDLTDDIQRLQSSSLRKSDLMPLQNAQTQSKEDLAQLSSALERQEKKLQDAKLANSTLRDELTDARTELNKALQSQQRSAAALMEEKLDQITNSNKEKSNKFDDQLSELAKKQKKLEEVTKTLQETMTQVKAEAGQRLSRSSTDREEENDKLRQRLARSVVELEALATTKADAERRFASEEQQFQARLKELRTSLTETEKQKEAQRLELMQKLQEESKLMGVAQGKNSLLENLLAREKFENEEKHELVRKSKKEVAEVREQIRNLESEKEKKVRQLTSELQAKQTQVGLLTKTLKRIETASAKMLDLSKREAKTVRRVKATKEHELFIAQLKLKEMEHVAQALQNGDEMKKQAALTAASTEERNELEKLLLESQLEKDELKQELEEMTEEFNAAKDSQKVIMEDTITKLSSDYDEKISELKQQISDKEQAMRQLRDTLVEKSNLDALEDELTSLKDEKNDLLEQIQRAQIEHERVTLKTETNLRLEHATEFAAMKSKFEERISELEGAKSELETAKATIAQVEQEMEKQEALHKREVANLTHEIKEARSKIDECTAQILGLEEVKARLEGEVSQMEANIGGASAEKEEELAAIKSQMQSEVDKLRAELAEVSSTLEEKQTQLKEAKQSDEANRQRLVEMAMAQEEMQSRYVSQIDSLTLKLNQERESSRAREQELEDTIDKLNADVKSLKAESSEELEAARSELTDQMNELTTTLKGSQHREQQLQSRLKRILEELVQAANASGENEVPADAEMSDDEAITHHLDALYSTHRRTAHELERLQAEYELTVKQAAADSATAQELDNQVKEHETQIKELESVVEQLREELKEQYHKSAIIAKGSDEFSDEMASLREEKRQLERQLQEEEKDRAKREVSYQRRTEMKEREVEELRTENKTLTAAVAAVREKIRAVENMKYHDLGELQSKLKDLEERTAALQPDENNIANIEKDFTTTRQEIVTLTADVQSLYQNLTACCGIMEWSELRASVFDEEEKLTRVRAENARELAKVQSVEQEVLMNAEFLNALLVAHGSTGGDGNLLNDFRWMQKYASIAPEIVEKLRKVESRLRDAVLDLHDGSTSLFPGGSNAPGALADEVVERPPNSQNSTVDGAAIAIALEKAKDDYFSETSETAEGLDDEDVKDDVDQPDVELESFVDHEGEGASYENVDVEGQDSIGDMSHDESGTCADELVVAEHVVHDEQEISREEEQGATSVAMSNLDEDEELSDDVAKDSFKSEQDRIDDDVEGLVSSVDRKIEEMTKMQSKWNSVGISDEDDDMDEVERLMLERSLAHSSKQVKPRIDNECDDSDEFATTIVGAETEEKQSEAASDEMGEDSADDTKPGEASANLEFVEQAELGDAGQEVRSEEEEDADDLDPFEESSFDNTMMSALEDKQVHSRSSTHEALRQTTQNDEVEASDSEGFVVQDAVTESSLDDSMMSGNDDDSSNTRFANDAGADVDTEVKFAAVHVELTPGEQNSELENSIDGDFLSDNEVSVDAEQVGDESSQIVAEGDNELEESQSTVANDDTLADQLDEKNAIEELLSSVERLNEDNALEESSLKGGSQEYSNDAGHALKRSAVAVEFDEADELEESVTSVASNAPKHLTDEDNALEESSQSVERGEIADQYEKDDALEESSSSMARAAIDEEHSLERSGIDSKNVEPKQLHDALEDSSVSLERGASDDEDNKLDESATSIVSGGYEENELAEPILTRERSALTRQVEEATSLENVELKYLDEDSGLKKGAATLDTGALADEFDEENELDESATSIVSGDHTEVLNDLEESLSSVRSIGQLEKGNTTNVATPREESVDLKQLDTGNSLDESATRLDNGTAADHLRTYGIRALEESTSSVASGVVVEDALEESQTSVKHDAPVEPQEGEHNALEESSSSFARASREEYRENSPDSRHAYEADDDDIHGGRDAVVLSRSDPLESSFDADMQSDNEEASASSDIELSVQRIKHREEDEDEWSEEQLRAAEHSLDRALAPKDDHGATDDVEPTATRPMALRLDDDESSEEEETMTVQTQVPLSANLIRFGMGARRLNLEEDDEMDEIERLLLDQSASSMEKRQQQSSRSIRPLGTDDDDEFGESSLQSRGDDDEFGDYSEDSIRSREDIEFGGVSVRSRDNEVGKQSARSEEMLQQRLSRFDKSRANDEFGVSSLHARSDDEEEFGEDSIRSREDNELGEISAEDGMSELSETRQHQLNRLARPLTDDDDEFGETSLQSRGDDTDAFGENSIRSREDNAITGLRDDGYSERLIRSNSNEEEKQHQSSQNTRRTKLPAIDDDNEFGESSFQSQVDDDEFGEDSVRSHEDNEFGELSSRPLNNAFSERSNANRAQLDKSKTMNVATRREGSVDLEQPDVSNSLDDSASSLDNVTATEYLHTYGTNPLPSSVASGAVAEIESKREAPVEPLDEDAALEQSTSSVDNTAPTLALASEGGDDNENGNYDLHVGSDATVLSRSDPLESSFDAEMQSDQDEEAFRIEDDESSEEEETRTVQTQPTSSARLSRFGMGGRRLNLEEDDEMDEIERLLLDQSTSSMHKGQQEPSRSTRPRSTEDYGEFGESLLQSRGDDDDFGEDSIRSREDNEFGETSSKPLDNAFSERSARSNSNEAQLDKGSVVNVATRREESVDLDASNSLDDSISSLDNGTATGHLHINGANAIEDSTSSVTSGVVAENAPEESESSMRHDATVEPLDEDTALEQLTSSFDNAAPTPVLASGGGGDDALEESSSSLASASREEYRENSPDSRHAYEADDDDIHVGRDGVVFSQSDSLERSFDAEMQSDNEEASASSDIELSVQRIKHREEDEDEWSEEQLRAAEHSLDRALAPKDDHGATDDVEPTATRPMALRLDDDESSEEEETMTVQTQVPLSANLIRFGMGARRLNLEEDDEMDEIERLLLDQSASSMEKRQQQSSRSIRPLGTDDDDEFGESSLQSRDDEIGEDSIRSREDNEFGEISVRPGYNSHERVLQQQSSRFTRPLEDEEDDFGESSLLSRNGDEVFGENSIRLREDNELGEISARPHDGGLSETRQQQIKRDARPLSDDGDEFGEASFQSRDDDTDAFGENSIRSREDNAFGQTSDPRDDEYGERSVQSNSNEEKHQHQSSRNTRFTTPTAIADDDEFGEASLQSRGDDDEFGEDPIRSREDNKFKELSSRPRVSAFNEQSNLNEARFEKDNARNVATRREESVHPEQLGSATDHLHTYGTNVLEESTSNVASGAIEKSETSVQHDATVEPLDESTALEQSTSSIDDTTLDEQESERNALEESSSSLASASREEYRENSPDRISGRHSSEDDDIHVGRDGVVFSRSDSLERSFDAEMQSDNEEASASSDIELSVQRIKHREEDEDEWSEEQLRAAEHSLDRALAPKDDHGATDDVEPTATRPMALRLDDDESSEEEETMTVQAQVPLSANLIRFGMGARRLNLEEDDEMDEIERLLLDQSASSMEKRQQQSSRSIRPLGTDDDDEVGESSLQSRDDEIGEDSIRSREDNEFGEISVRPGYNSHERVLQQQSSRFTRPLEDEEDDFGESSLLSRSGDGSEFSEVSVRRLNQSFGESSLKLKSNEETRQSPSRRLSGFTKHLVDEESDFGDTSFQSRSDNEDEFGEASLRSRGSRGSREGSFDEVLNQSRSHDDNELGEASIRSKSLEKDEFGEDSVQYRDGNSNIPRLHEESRYKAPIRSEPRGNTELGEALSRLRDADEFGCSSIRLNPRDADEFGQSSTRKVEFGEASIGTGSYDEDDFGEISIPLQEEDSIVAPPAPSRLQNVSMAGRITHLNDRGMVYHEGLMNSPAKVATNMATTSRDDSVSEAEHDYMDESFDLDESMEEEGDDDERDV